MNSRNPRRHAGGPELATAVAVVLAVFVGCARATPLQPVSSRPQRVQGETVRGPLAGAEIVEARTEASPTGRQRLDFDDDGGVDREEFRNFFARAFHSVDEDDDRVLRGAELAELPAGLVPKADRDGSGTLDVEEYVGVALDWFTRCDANSDDVLGPDEEAACRGTAR